MALKQFIIKIFIFNQSNRGHALVYKDFRFAGTSLRAQRSTVKARSEKLEVCHVEAFCWLGTGQLFALT
jgi:hypothetical protein